MTVGEFDNTAAMKGGRRIILVDQAYTTDVISYFQTHSGIDELRNEELNIIASIWNYGDANLNWLLHPAYSKAEIRHMMIGDGYVVLLISPAWEAKPDEV